MLVNESALDRIGRIVVGSALVTLAFLGPKALWIIPGAALLATGLGGFCPVYRFLGYSSREPRMTTRGELKVLFSAAFSVGIISMAVTAKADQPLALAGLVLGLLAFPLAFMAVLGLFRESEVG